MEHSALHALLLTGLIVALGGGWAMVGIILPAVRGLGAGAERDRVASDLGRCIAKWVVRAALAAALASTLDLFIQAAELEGRTVFGGVDLGLVARFATQSEVGRLVLLRIGLLLLTAAAAGWVKRRNGEEEEGEEGEGTRTPLHGWVLVAGLAFGISFRSHQCMNREHLCRVGPGLPHRPA